MIIISEKVLSSSSETNTKRDTSHVVVRFFFFLLFSLFGFLFVLTVLGEMGLSTKPVSIRLPGKSAAAHAPEDHVKTNITHSQHAAL